MFSFKDFKNWIGSVKNMCKIIKVMQMVVVVKLCCVQEVVEVVCFYVDCMVVVMVGLIVLVVGLDGVLCLLVGIGDDRCYLLVVMILECGFVGGFNLFIVKLVCMCLVEFCVVGKDVIILIVGKKGCEQLKCDFGDVFVYYVDLSEVKCIGYDNVCVIVDEILDCFDVGNFDVVMLFYVWFEFVISQVLIVWQIIFVVVEEGVEVLLFYDYELDEIVILNDLLLCLVVMQVFVVFLENFVFEQGVWMSVMDNVICNVGDMINKLIIEYNWMCQVVIIKEFIEIILGVEVF